MPEKTRMTMAFIAQQAGTSLATVSKTLNGRPGVGSEKRDEILRLLEENGYHRRGTQNRKTVGLIDFVMRGVDTPWATSVLIGAEDEAARAGASLVLFATHGRALGNRHWLHSLAQRRSDGIVLVTSRINEGAEATLTRLRIPIVLVDPIGTAWEGVPTVGASNFAGGVAATEHLISLGHTKIGIIAGDPNLDCAQERLAGYRSALTKAGITLRSEYMRFGDFLTTGGYAAADAMLNLADPPTAIFAGSDQQAYGVYEAAKAHGLSIPRDLSVVGFDDVALCQWVSPKLTTIRQPLEEMAREAVRILCSMAYQDTRPPQPKIELGTTLVVRESTCPPKL